MRVITFYSYKGGVGRTLAAANFAVYLAKLGLKTIIIDFDLEAPGIDAKFGLPKFSETQKGLLDYILAFQQTNQDPGNIKDIIVPVPLNSSEENTLWLIPAGQYLSESYYRNLNQLNWGLIFSDKRDGVSFFQQFLAHLERELAAEFVIIDSRTGITEIAGLCTQQLADEVVMLSSLSSESIRVTKHIKELIKNSQIAKALEKEIDVKIVVSRVPKPDDLLAFKEECCEMFGVADDKLFFLFSCPELERKEFLAINELDANEELISNYIKLFYALNLELANSNILAEIENVTRHILLVSPEEAEKSVLQLAAMYPHPEVYRIALRFFMLKGQEKDVRIFAWKLLDLLPNDEEVQSILANSYLKTAEKVLELEDENIPELFLEKAIRAIEPLYQKNQLNHEEIKIYAQILAKAEKHQESLDIALKLAEDDTSDSWIKYISLILASNSAFQLGDDGLSDHLEQEAKQLKNQVIADDLDDIPI